MQDELTRLPNRRYLMYSLEKLVESARKNRSFFAVVNLDLDRFKHVNDSYGHVAGDQLLQDVAGCIKEHVRASDVVARVGGDEFLILLPRMTDASDIDFLVRKLKKAIGQIEISGDKGTMYSSVSIGYAIYNDPSIDIDAILHMADIDMYESKRRNRTSLHSV